MTAALDAYLRALWNTPVRTAALGRAQAEADVPPRPVLCGRPPDEDAVLQLPLHAPFATQPGWAQAAASHAAAHWRFGGAPLPRAGLKPIQQALFATLEDARVEALALRELPGLRALWLPFHAGHDAAAGAGFEALLARLARCLLDPAHDDPHPWVAKARAACRDTAGSFALLNAQAVRRVASLLGNDIGQMRLPFNARTWRVHAAYRDDGSWLWLPDDRQPPSDTPLDAAGGEGTRADPATGAPPMPVDASARPDGGGAGMAGPAAATEPVATYAEWDHRIARYRADWCHVHVPDLPPATGTTLDKPTDRRVARALAGLRGAPRRSGGRAAEGDDFHPAALVDARIAQRLRHAGDGRVYRRVEHPAPPLAVLVLLDTSASTADAAPGGLPLLDGIRAAARDTALALEALGHRCALAAFASRGRQRVEVPWIKHWRDPARSPAVAARLAALASGGSTRLGAVLRHGTALSLADAARHPGARRLVVLVTDGEPHDIDIHDPVYLGADLRRAAAEARARGVAAHALVLAPGDARALAAHLGRTACAGLDRPGDLPQRLVQLLRPGGA